MLKLLTMKKIILILITAASASSLFAQTMTTSEYNKLQNQEREFKLNGGMKTLLRIEQDAQAQHSTAYKDAAAIKKLQKENLQLQAEIELLKKEIENLKKN